MKKGDVIMIRDSSYSKIITEHGLEDSYAGMCGIRNEQGTVIELNCKFPNPHKYQEGCTFNNTVVRTDSGKVVFIEERFLELVLPTHKVMVDIKPFGSGIIECGKIVEVSDKLYKEIKRGSQS